MNFGACGSVHYGFVGDSVIAGITYSKLYSFPGTPDDQLVALLREDSAHRVFSADDGLEHLLYDFMAEVGDTVRVSTPMCPWPLVHYVVYQVDSVPLLNGEYRRRQWFWETGERWILGIGSNAGPYAFDMVHCISDVFPWLNCFSVNDSLLYGPTFPACDWSNVGMGTHERSAIAIGPNPFSDHLNVQAPDGLVLVEISLFDQQGRPVLYSAGRASQLSLNTTALKPGSYLVQVHFEGHPPSHSLAVKQ